MVQFNDDNRKLDPSKEDMRPPLSIEPANSDDSAFALSTAFFDVFQRQQVDGLKAYFDRAVWPEAERCMVRAQHEFEIAAAVVKAGRAERDHLLAKLEIIDGERSRFRELLHDRFIGAIAERGLASKEDIAELKHRVHRAQRFFADVTTGLALAANTEVVLVDQADLDPDFAGLRKEHGAEAQQFHAAIEALFMPPHVEHIPWLSEELAGVIRRKQAERSDAAHKEIRISGKFDVEEVELRGARAFFDSVLGELILNALDAVPESGGRIYCHAREEDRHLVLSVADNGPGMSDATLARIFEQGFSTKKNGTGSGLAILHSIVEEQGGFVEVSTHQGFGTTFTVHVPLYSAEDAAHNRLAAFGAKGYSKVERD